MKNLKILTDALLLSAMMLFCAVTHSARAQCWVNVGSAGFSTAGADYVCLRISTSNVPYVVFEDLGSGGVATVMKYTAPNWVTVGGVAATPGTAEYTTLALSSSTPHIAYRDWNNSNWASARKYVTSWVNEGTIPFSANTATYTSIAISPTTSYTYVAYSDANVSSKVTVKRNTGGSTWSLVGIQGFSAGLASFVSLVFDGSGTPYVAYRDNGNSQKITVMKFDGTDWVLVGSAGFSPGLVSTPSLAISSSGTPYVAFGDAANSSKLTVMTWDGSNWVPVGGTYGFTANAVDYPSIAIDASGTPYVAFEDWNSSFKTTVMKFDGSNWVTVGSAGFSAGTANYISLAIDGSGTPYVAYKDYGNSQKVTVMKYSSSPTIATNTISGSPFCQGASVSVPYTATCTFVAGNIFTAQLSNSSGSFASPISIGTLTSTASGTISATIPGGASAGSGYRIRVVSDNPVVTGTDNGSNLTVQVCSGITWTGAVDDDWFTAGNWSNTAVPTSTSDITIPNVSPNPFPVINGPGTASVRDLTLNASASLTVTIVNSPQLDIYGNVSNSGTGSFGSGKVAFKGTAQSITGAMASSGIVYVNTGSTLTTNGNLTLNSGASLMHGTGTTGGGGSVSGNVTVKRAGTGNGAKYNYWSSPVAGANVSVIGSAPYYYNPDNATDNTTEAGLKAGWVSAGGTMAAGTGYIGKGGGTASFTGAAGNGSYTPTVKKNATTGVAWNLIGNPYPSAVDAAAFLSANTNITGSLYFWDDDATGGSDWHSSDYAAWNGAGGVGPNSGLVFGGYIASGQSFFVEKIASGSGTVSFTNSTRSTQNNVFFRTAPIERLWLNVIGPNNVYNETLLAFLDDATDGYDLNYDARKLKGNANIAFYTRIQNESFAIQGLSLLAQDKTVTLGIDAGVTGNYTLNLKTIENIDETVTVILEDTETGTFQNLSLNGTYTFSAAAGSYASRFVLHFNPALKIETNDATCAGNDATIMFQQDGSKLWNYMLMDASGRMIERKAGFNGMNVFRNMAPGVYTLKLTDDYGYQTTKSIELNGKALVIAGFTASSQSVNVNEEITFANLSDGAAMYEWNFGDGTVSNDESPAHAYISAGEYDVLLRSRNDDCEETSSRKVTVAEKATGISNPSQDVSIFAAGRQIYIDFKGVADVKGQVQVFNTLGQLMLAKDVHTAGKIMMDAGNFATSCYFLKIVSSDNVLSKKIFIGE